MVHCLYHMCNHGNSVYEALTVDLALLHFKPIFSFNNPDNPTRMQPLLPRLLFR